MRSVIYQRACGAVLIGVLAIAFTVVTPISRVTPVFAQVGGPVAVTPGATSLGISKLVRDVTTNGAFAASITATAGDLLQYSITVSNPTAAAANSVVVSDTLTAGQSYATSSTCSPSCYFSGATIFFNVGTLPSGTMSTPLTFSAYVSSAASGAIVSNVATATSSLGTFSSQPTYITVGGQVLVPSGSCGYSPCGTPCGYSPCGTPCGYSPCGTPCGYNPCGTTCGTCTALPAPCSSYCAPTTCAYSCAATTCATSNCFTFGTGQNMLCGTVSAYTPATGTASGYLTMNGSQVALMPYMVPSGQIAVGQPYCISLVMNNSLQATSAVVSPNLPGINCGCSYSIAGVPSCSLLSTSGVVQGSLSVVPTAAKAVEDPTWVHHVTRTSYAT